MKKQASKQYSILQRYPEPVLNNTTTNHLGNTPEPIEVFPPEIFFKGKQFLIKHQRLIFICNAFAVSSFFKYVKFFGCFILFSFVRY